MLGTRGRGHGIDASIPRARRVPPLCLGYRPALDGVRGIAVSLVVLFHLGATFWSDAEWNLHGGFVGVDLFFALSGFLITVLLLSEFDRSGRVDVLQFLCRRLVRLVPALAVVVGVRLALSLADIVPMRAHYAFESSLWTLAFIPTWPGGHHVLAPELGQTWSLAIEGQFYLLWSITLATVVVLAPRHPRQILMGLAAAGTLAVVINRLSHLHAEAVPPDLGLSSLYRLDGPLVGALVGALGGIAFASGWLDRVPQRALAVLTTTGLLVLGYISMVAMQLHPILYRGGFTLIAVVSTAVVVGSALLQEGRTAAVLRWRPLVVLGRMSYSIFLWHMGVFTIVQRQASAWPLGLRVGTALVVAATCSALSYNLIERPGLRLARPRPIVVTATAHIDDHPDTAIPGASAARLEPSVTR